MAAHPLDMTDSFNTFYQVGRLFGIVSFEMPGRSSGERSSRSPLNSTIVSILLVLLNSFLFVCLVLSFSRYDVMFYRTSIGTRIVEIFTVLGSLVPVLTLCLNLAFRQDTARIADHLLKSAQLMDSLHIAVDFRRHQRFVHCYLGFCLFTACYISFGHAIIFPLYFDYAFDWWFTLLMFYRAMAHELFIGLTFLILMATFAQFRAINVVLSDGLIHKPADKCVLNMNRPATVKQLGTIHYHLIKSVDLFNRCFAIQVIKYSGIS